MGPGIDGEADPELRMQILGFRQNVGVIEKVMERYIPQVTVIGGALVGLLAVWANMLGTIGGVSGTDCCWPSPSRTNCTRRSPRSR